ncbi:MAG: hypothetical protein JSV78_09855 [Phycisphaerales bacterium]|nr:MAG: hypothetical protein JSV78_09855 [Phycisphaerales bacterium]
MQARTRMFKALGCLVLAMTGASLLLAWMDPSPPIISPPTISGDERLAGMRGVVVERVDVRDGRWNSIEIVAGASAASGRLLRASSQQREVHFVVDDLGKPHRIGLWDDQRGAAGKVGTVRIEVVQPRSGEPMTAAQLATLQALILAINEEIMPGDSSLPIRLDGAWSRVYGLQEGDVFDLAPHR